MSCPRTNQERKRSERQRWRLRFPLWLRAIKTNLKDDLRVVKKLRVWSTLKCPTLPSPRLGHLSTESPPLLLESTPFYLTNIVLPTLHIVPHPRSRPGQCIRFPALLSKCFIPIPYRARLRPPHRTQHIFKFIFQTATTAPPMTGTRPTQREVFFISLPPSCVFLFHHQPRKVVLLELGHPLHLTCTIRGKRGHRAQARGRLDVRSRRILVKERGERFWDGLTLGAFIASGFRVGHRSQFGGLVNAIALVYLFVVFPVRGMVVVDQILRVGPEGQGVLCERQYCQWVSMRANEYDSPSATFFDASSAIRTSFSI
jgi:hypothetical protein